MAPQLDTTAASTTGATATQTAPTGHKPGIYQVAVSNAYCHVYRNGKLLTTARGVSNQYALAQARRNVRLARRCDAFGERPPRGWAHVG